VRAAERLWRRVPVAGLTASAANEALTIQFDIDTMPLAEFDDATAFTNCHWFRSQALVKGPKWFVTALFNRGDAFDELHSPSLLEEFFAFRASVAGEPTDRDISRPSVTAQPVGKAAAWS